MSILAYPQHFATGNQDCIRSVIQKRSLSTGRRLAWEPLWRTRNAARSAKLADVGIKTHVPSFALTKPGVKEGTWEGLGVYDSTPSAATTCGMRGAPELLLDLNRGHFSLEQELASGCP
jgi:hypothetical protein